MIAPTKGRLTLEHRRDIAIRFNYLHQSQQTIVNAGYTITTMMMFLAANSKGLSMPTFSARKVRMKRKRRCDGVLGYRWETYTVTADVVERDLKEVTIPFMRATGSTLLDMDNARVQTAQQEMLAEEGIESTGFAAQWVEDKGGHPPNSPDTMLLDATVFSVVRREFARAQPQTIPQAINVAKKIVAGMTAAKYCSKYIADLDDLYAEIIASGGQASHHMS